MDPKKTIAEETVVETAEKEEKEEKSVPTIPADKQKPVYMYIAILFVAAAMLIALSLLMHRNSNEEVLGQLQSSVNAIEALQESQLQNIELQKEVSDLEEQLADLTAQAETDAKTAEALQWLAIIEQQYSMEEYQTCFESIEKFKLSGTVEYLPTENTLTETAVSPAERFAALDQAVTEMDIP